MTTDEPVDYERTWHAALEDMDKHGIGSRDRAYLNLTRFVGLLGDNVLLSVPFDQTKRMLEGPLREPVAKALSDQLGQQVRVAISVDESLQAAVRDLDDDGDASDENTSAATESDDGTLGFTMPGQGAPRPTKADPGVVLPPRSTGYQRDAAAAPSDTEAPRLNPKYTFDTFVIGESNRFAHAAAIAIAEEPGQAYNPLFIHGDSGLGKTHLLHAIGHYVHDYHPKLRVRYVSSEEFTNDFVNSIRDDRAATFQRRYRDDVDVLLIDDIQFLQGKEQTQEEFFHTFNALHSTGKQIVLTSDQPPEKLTTFADRMRSRFKSGLTTDVHPPELETRIAILRKKANAERMDIGDDVLELIASKISTNIRELEGALIRVAAYASLQKEPVDRAKAAFVLKDVVPSETGQITVGHIIAETAVYFGVTVDDIKGPSRSRNLTMARQIAMYLSRELTEHSFPQLGQHFGGRDHTTVMHAEKKIRQLIGERRPVYDQITELTTQIRRRSH
ncbi:chromosomal replication initiator protein DnaA [Dermacoccus nishinomiyaensis]|uniref:Chromosomal replication initiator protein DnaA n=3 Tax=Dermacoccaceae TaxID=145357 RepID=A0A075JEX9_9MICO|nr:chromosomal replication initiator protein DnaA [Dermacoccus nishinomiyaensis]AIF39757.1 chromosomal replication initiation protein [Dermacoccus nishinomiyaensis]EFP58535.1 chromosomal replication initiator protein DnaA [Dermacoccus sp. Ellin185]TCJ90377.1 chromosomal replication initiator protein DnaA [Dermacoccus sp. SAI-028]